MISILAFQIILWCKEYLYISKWSERFHCCKVLLNAWVHRWISILPFRRLSLVWHQLFLPTLMGVLNSEISRCTWLYSSHTKKPQHNHDIIHLITPHEWKWNCLFTAANKLTFSPGCICLFKKLWLDFFYINLLSMIWRISRSPLSSNLFFLWHSVVCIPLPRHWQNMYCCNDLAMYVWYRGSVHEDITFMT